MPGIIPGIIDGAALAAAAWAMVDAPGAGSAAGVTAPLAEPGIGIANGFHIFCMNAIASCAVNGAAALPLFVPDSSAMSPLPDRRARGIARMR
jgi:hypothetical protein